MNNPALFFSFTFFSLWPIPKICKLRNCTCIKIWCVLFILYVVFYVGKSPHYTLQLCFVHFCPSTFKMYNNIPKLPKCTKWSKIMIGINFWTENVTCLVMILDHFAHFWELRDLSNIFKSWRTKMHGTKLKVLILTFLFWKLTLSVQTIMSVTILDHFHTLGSLGTLLHILTKMYEADLKGVILDFF